MTGDEYALQWTRETSVPLERWSARLIAPYRSGAIAQVNWAELRGRWLLQVMPHGSGMDGPTCWGVYATKEKAMAQVERWLRYHWRSAPPHVPPHFGGVRLDKLEYRSQHR